MEVHPTKMEIDKSKGRSVSSLDRNSHLSTLEKKYAVPKTPKGINNAAKSNQPDVSKASSHLLNKTN